jgi:hypothetical protein
LANTLKSTYALWLPLPVTREGGWGVRLMPSYNGHREQELARRVRRMLIEQSAILQEESPDEFLWLTQHYPGEQQFFEEELGARLELRLANRAQANGLRLPDPRIPQRAPVGVRRLGHGVPLL